MGHFGRVLRKRVAQPNTKPTFTSTGIARSFFFFFFFILGLAHFWQFAIHWWRKKKQCGLWVCFVCNANKELPRTVNSTVSVSQSAMSSLLYIFCIFCSVYLLSAQRNWEDIEGFEISTDSHLCGYSCIRFAASLVYLYCFALFHLFG